jgi:hypothetical protein
MLAFLFAVMTTPCPVERAHYTLRTMPSLTASFNDVPIDEDWRAGVAFGIRSSSSGRTYWFLPANGDPDILASTTDIAKPNWRPPSPDGGIRPLGDMQLLTFDADYNVLDDIPRRDAPAPAHILIPDLREAFWYRTPGDKREGSAKQFFDLTGCAL